MESVNTLVTNTLMFIAQKGWTTKNQAFYDSLSLFLAKSLNVSYFIIAKFLPEDNVAETLSYVAFNEVKASIFYPLKNTPCENVMGRSLCCYVKNIQELFPLDSMLVDMKAQSYIGIPLWDTKGAPIGLIALLDTKTINNATEIETILQIVAVRVAHEIERNIFENELVVKNQKLEESEETYRMLYNSMNDALFTSELNKDGTLGKFILVNDIACKRLGYTREELLSKTPSDINSEKARQLLGSRIQKVIKEKHIVVESENVTKDGRIIPIELSTNIAKFRNKIIFNSVARDITDRKQSEEALLKSKNILRLFIENVPASIAMFDCDMKYLANSRRYLIDYDLENKNLIGCSHYDIFPEMPERWKDIHRRCIAGAIEKCDEDTFPRANGKTDWVKWKIHPWFESDEKIGGIILFSEVINERKQAELLINEKTDEIEAQNEEYQQINEQLNQTNQKLSIAKEHAEESDRLKTAFLQNMSHEIRTPMNAIMGFSDLLVRNFEDKPKLKKFSDIIGQRSSDLLNIINDILDIAKIESGQLPVNLEESNLSELFAELTSFFVEYQKRIGKQHIKFSLQAFCVQKENIIITDKVKLKQILINLITNAFKFTNDGKIESGCKFDENHNLLFYITDTGIGIPSDKHKVVFERFTQLQQSSKMNIGGTGLGLPIVKGLIGLLGGKIFLQSEPNKGSTFSFSIPFKTTKAVIHEPFLFETHNDKNLINKTILIVEDDYYNSEYLKEILSNIAINILQAEDGKQAIEISLSQPVDLVLMDIRLPDMSGYEALRQIRQHKPHLKIIAQTAYASHDENQNAIDAGCIDYISKPIKQELLLSMIHKHL